MFLGSLAQMAAAAGYLPSVKGPKKPRVPKMNLSSDEIGKLTLLYGKEKRNYVKELKLKYKL